MQYIPKYRKFHSFQSMMADDCLSVYNNLSSFIHNGSYCPAFFDRIACWPPTKAGVLRKLECPAYFFPHVKPDAYASRLCTNKSIWEERSHYDLCIGCSTNNNSDMNTTEEFSLPLSYIISRRYFVIGANGLSIILLIISIITLLGNRRLRQRSRNILHVNICLGFFIRSIIQIIAEVYMSHGYFSHNVFHRTDSCNRTTIYFREDQLIDCKLFIVFMNYINNGVAHWFVFCEGLYLYRLLLAKAASDNVLWYIVTGWSAPFYLTIITYGTRIATKTDLGTCWFEPSIYDWILHGPNVILQFFNFIIFNYVCILLARKLNQIYQTRTSEQKRFAKYSRLARSTLILLPLFGIHYFLFIWNIKPFLIPKLIYIHLTFHTIASSLQGVIVASLYTIINSEVQHEILRSLDRCLIHNFASWEESNYLRNYINKLDNERSYSVIQNRRPSIRLRTYSTQSNNSTKHHLFVNRQRTMSSNVIRQNSNDTTNFIGDENVDLNSKENHL